MYYNNKWLEERKGEERNFKVFSCFQCLQQKKETLKLILFYEIAGYLAELTLQKENFNKLLGSRKLRSRDQSEKLQKIAKNCKKYEKCLSYFKYVLPLFHIVRKNPLKKLEHHVDSHDDIEIHSAENNRFTNG